MPRIVYDRESCSGFFSCVEVDPEDFERGDAKSILQGATEVREDVFEKEVPEERVEAACEAASVCPVDCIKVVDDDGTVLAGPEELPIER